jgi:hypothetical protein
MRQFILSILLCLSVSIGWSQHDLAEETNQNDAYYIRTLERKIEFMADSMHKLERSLSIVKSNKTYVKSLELENKNLLDSIYRLQYELTASKRIMLTEHLRKKAWIKVVAAETVIVGGVILAAATGLIVPVAMGVAAFELCLLVEGNYRLNTRQLRKMKKENPEN